MQLRAPATLQSAYNASADPEIVVAASPGPLTVRDNAAPIGNVFEVQDNAGQNALAVDPSSGGVIDVGKHEAVLSAGAEPIYRIQDASNSCEVWPTVRTFTTAPGSVFRKNSTETHNYASVSMAVLDLQNTAIHQLAGFAFNHALIFNHGTTYYNALNVNVNYGPVQGFIDQPSIFVNRTSAGAITMGLFRSFLSQPRFGRQSTSGTITVTAAANFQAFGNVTTGATITTWTRVQLGPFITPLTGVVTNYRAIDIANETLPTTIVTAIRSAIASGGGGTRRNIEVTGDAVSTFAGDVHMNDGVALVLGSVGASGVELSRPLAGVMRMAGVGGAFNESLDWDFQNSNNVAVTSASGAGLNFDLTEIAFGPSTVADGTNNWVFAFSPGLRATQLGGDYSEVLFTSSSAITVAHAIGTFATWTINFPTVSIGAGSVTNATNVLIQTNPNVGTGDRTGLRITSNPTGGGGVNAALYVTAGLSRFDGRVDINNGIALGGGAAATLGTIGGSGPTAAAQAQWLEIDIGGTPHWIPVWT